MAWTIVDRKMCAVCGGWFFPSRESAVAHDVAIGHWPKERVAHDMDIPGLSVQERRERSNSVISEEGRPKQGPGPVHEVREPSDTDPPPDAAA